MARVINKTRKQLQHKKRRPAGRLEARAASRKALQLYAGADRPADSSNLVEDRAKTRPKLGKSHTLVHARAVGAKKQRQKQRLFMHQVRRLEGDDEVMPEAESLPQEEQQSPMTNLPLPDAPKSFFTSEPTLKSTATGGTVLGRPAKPANNTTASQ